MTIIKLFVEVPDTHSLNIEAARKSLGETCAKQVADWVTTAEKEKEKQAALESDEGLAVWLRKHYPDRWEKGDPPRDKYDRILPIVRASTYASICQRQELHEFRWCSDKRRPVVMRGSWRSLQGKYTLQSGYAEDVVGRYLRRIRFTSNDPDEIETVLSSAVQRACKLYESHRSYGPSRRHIGDECAYIDGKLKWFDKNQAAKMQKLFSLTRKFSALEARI